MKWEEVQAEVERIFRRKARILRIKPKLEMNLIEDASIIDSFVYGEAFPDENRVWLEIVAPDASVEEITEIICHELIHIKYPLLGHDTKEFAEKLKNVLEITNHI